MKPLSRTIGFCSTLAAIALVSLPSCKTTANTLPDDAAKSSPPVVKRDAISATTKRAVEDPPKPNRKEPLPRALKTEQDQVDQVVELVKRSGTKRVLIRLESDAFPQVEPPHYDSRAKRSTTLPDPRRSPDQSKTEVFRNAQSKFLERFDGGDRQRVRQFPGIPYIAMDLNLKDAQSLQSWIRERTAGSSDRPFRIWVEADVPLKQQSAPAQSIYTTVEEAGTYMEFDGFTSSATPSTVIILDGPVDDNLNLLQGHIDAIQKIDSTSVVDVPVSTIPADPTSYLNMSHGTKLALIVSKASPSARIVVLDIYGNSSSTSVENIMAALVVIRDKWCLSGRSIASVCLSSGFADMPCSSNCDCTTEPMYAGCNVLKDGVRELIDQLAAYQVPVVISAGNDAIYRNEVFYPSCLTSAVSVGGTRTGVRAGVSNWGPMLDLAAQGADVTLKMDQWISPPTSRYPTLLGSGSSFAAAFVSSAYSVLLDAHPEATTALIDEALRKTGYAVEYDYVTVPELRVLTASKWLSSPPPADAVPVATTIVTEQPTPAPQ